MDVGTTGAEVFLIGLVIVALTASSLAAVAVGAIRANHGAWELLGELVVVSILVPVGLTYAATLLPPELFEFLR
jgi:hypothetical protein